ncbi:Holliday junction resolvase RuvX [Candidatus Peribacteria bacterium]|nr:MAG: Holliday junction resolvase RuvX [Candidatus Peribacteria bacterium]
MHLLALDIGKKRTGVAFVDTDNDIPLPLDTIIENTVDGMIERVAGIIDERGVDEVVIGLPLLPSGKEGEQVLYVRMCAEKLEERGVAVVFMDERYTTSKMTSFDGDARAACELLQTYLERR